MLVAELLSVGWPLGLMLRGTYREKHAEAVGIADDESSPMKWLPVGAFDPDGRPTSSSDLAEMLTLPSLNGRLIAFAKDAAARGDHFFVLEPLKLFRPDGHQSPLLPAP